MEVRNRGQAEAFTTLDGSTIRVLLDGAVGGAREQSLAEASLPAGGSTQRHYHARAEEIYVLLEGSGEMEVEGDRRRVTPGDAILIPAGGVARDPRRCRRRAPLPLLLCAPVFGWRHVL
jgi:quercetin dioxygenase-like cupin family protein